MFITNRRHLEQLLLPNSLAVVNANDILPTSADGTLRLHPASDLFYLTGVEQEESILLLYPEAHEERFREILFLRETNEQIATWEGHKLTREKARQLTGIQRVEWLPAFQPIFHRLMCECEHAYLNSNEHKRAAIEVETREARFVSDTMRRYPLHDYQRLARILHRLRVVKSELEVELIRHASVITRKGFERVCRFVKPDVTETAVEAEFAHEFIRRGGGFAYTPIIASGANACVLHYIENDQPCRQGDLLLLDVAASYANYNADMTRTIPVSGRFTRRQRQVYDAVLRVFRAASQAATPGKLPKDWQKEAEAVIEKELVDLGLLTLSQIRKQDPDEPAFKKYFMHGVGHPLGLDVHDVGPTVEPMQAGWVITVEPAIYIREEGLAVRLENDILVQEGGNVDLMEDIPLEAGAIEELMNRKRLLTSRPATRHTQPSFMKPFWTGVFPAVTTQLKKDQSLDLDATARHVEALIASGVKGLIFLGSLGENQALLAEEKRLLVEAMVQAVNGRVPVLSGVAESSTAEACRYVRDCERLGADGVMLMPAMLYKGDPRETLTHFRVTAKATGLPIMIYNNPLSYANDLTPQMFAELAAQKNFVALKESSGDTRRLTDLHNTVGDRYALFTGVDNLLLECAIVGIDGWVAGSGIAFPGENQYLWELTRRGDWEKAREIYRWFTPLLHLDVSTKFVQYIKLAVQECGLGREWVRAPRLTLTGEERKRVLKIIHDGIANRPKVPKRFANV